MTGAFARPALGIRINSSLAPVAPTASSAAAIFFDAAGVRWSAITLNLSSGDVPITRASATVVNGFPLFMANVAIAGSYALTTNSSS